MVAIGSPSVGGPEVGVAAVLVEGFGGHVGLVFARDGVLVFLREARFVEADLGAVVWFGGGFGSLLLLLGGLGVFVFEW